MNEIEKLKERAKKLNIVSINGMATSVKQRGDIDKTLFFLENYEHDKVEAVF
jgi:hypothetical protein